MPAPGKSPRRRWWRLCLLSPLLLILALVVAVLAVDPSRYRSTLEAQVRKQLGLGLDLQGELHWKLWPLLAIESGAGTLQAPLLSWQHLEFNADPWALLRRRWELGALRIDGLRLDLRRDANGHGNWEWPASNGPSKALQVQLGTLELKDAKVSYQDARSGSHWAVGPLDLQTDARIDRQPAAGTQLSVEHMKMKLGDARLEASVQGGIAGALTLRGAVDFRTPALRELLRSLGIKPPGTRDSQALGTARLATQWALQDQQLALDALQAQLDDTHLAGTVHVDLRGPAPRWQLDLKGDAVLLDRYLAPEDKASDARVPRRSVGSAAVSAAGDTVGSGAGNAAFALPVARLKSLPVAGVIELDSARAGGVTLQGVTLRWVGAQ